MKQPNFEQPHIKWERSVPICGLLSGLIPHKSGLGLRRMGYMQDPCSAR